MLRGKRNGTLRGVQVGERRIGRRLQTVQRGSRRTGNDVRGGEDTAAQSRKPISSNPSLSGGFVPGTLISDRYRIVALLGLGGMGEVYSSDDLKLGQRVALKFLPEDRGRSENWRERFYAEVRMARQVSHPNVCRVYDVGENNGRLFLSMEYVDGEDLASLLRRIGRLPDDKAVEVAHQLCAGLAAAHRSGVLHRDLKPANVMIDGKGLVRITDFGLAIPTTEAGRNAIPAGTPGYFAPESLDGAAPSVQSDLYALGLVLYELFTGKRAFTASGLVELRRLQTESSPAPPRTIVKSLDPAVERAILRCLDPDPSRRPSSAMSVAAALPGSDPLAAAVAAGETPSPEMVAAAGPSGLLRPRLAWAYFAATVGLILGTSVFLAPRGMDWGLARMDKSPEVLADRSEELAHKLGYSGAVDRASWVGSESGYRRYAYRNPEGKDWQAAPGRAWPSPVTFFYRQSPDWMTPMSPTFGPPMVTLQDPPHETAGMVDFKLDMQGHLLFLRAVPPQAEHSSSTQEPDWDALFAEAGLSKTLFHPASAEWAPPDAFDSRADWEGHLADQPDLQLHVAAAAFHGKPTYFQVIAPWDKPSRESSLAQAGALSKVPGLMEAAVLVSFVLIGGFFARRNIRRGRGDLKGGLRFVVAAVLLNCVFALLNYHWVPKADYIVAQFLDLGIPLVFALIAWIGYMAVEPYARRTWPKAMVSWQRLLSGNWRDPLVGRDVLIGCCAGAAIVSVMTGVGSLAGISEAKAVFPGFGRGVAAAVGTAAWIPSVSCLIALNYLAILAIMTGVLRRRWLGLTVTGLILVFGTFSPNPLDVTLTIAFAVTFLVVLTRVGLVAAICLQLMQRTLGLAPPLTLSRWYAGRGAIALLPPLALVVYGLYISLGHREGDWVR